MGLTKEEAQKLLGVADGAPCYLIRKRYKKLAHRYYPERNALRKDYALKKFQKIVEAYVRLNIDPDDCDQMKIKHILLEIYSYHDDIAGNDADLYSDDSEGADVDNVAANDHYHRFDSCSSSAFDSNSGPYSALLQDFTLRSYMSGERKSKPLLSSTRKSYVSELDRKAASQHAEELLKGVEEERRKDDTRKMKNKKKKEAKKKRKDKHSSSKTITKNKKQQQQQNDKSESSSDSDLDMDSAFFSRITSKVPVGTAGTSLVWNDNESLSGSESEDDNTTSPHDTTSTPSQQDSPEQKNKDGYNGGGVKDSNNSKNRNVTVRTIPRSEVPWDTRGKSYQRYYNNNNYQSELPPRLQKKLAAEGRYVVNNYSGASKKNNGGQQRTDNPINEDKPKTIITHTPIVQKEMESSIEQSRRLAVQGNKAAKDGQFEEAIESYTQAIDLYSNDERYYGNRSFCYEYLKDYQRGLSDADSAIQLKNDWPKGHFRRGKALIGLKQYKEAENSLQRAVQLDPSYHDAAEELRKVLEILYPVQVNNNGASIKDTVQSNTDNVINEMKRVHIEHSQPTIPQPGHNYYQDVASSQSPLLYFESTSPLGFEQVASQPSSIDRATNPTGQSMSFDGAGQLGFGQTSQASFERINQLSFSQTSFEIQPHFLQTSQTSQTDFGRDSQSSNERISQPSLYEQTQQHQGTETSPKIESNPNNSLSDESSNIETVPKEGSPLHSKNTPNIELTTNTSTITTSANNCNANTSTSNTTITSTNTISDDDVTSDTETMQSESSDKLSDTLRISNIDPVRIDEKLLFKTFKSCGRILKIQVQSDGSCAHIRFDKPESATAALNKYKGSSIADCQIKMRYSDHLLPTKTRTFVYKNNKSNKSVGKGECHYWRLNGCYYGRSCRFIHIPKNKGIDLKQKKPFNNNNNKQQ